MKELSIEEKAKRYDEAIEKAKSKIKDDKDHVLYEDDIIDLFPELKGLDLEDERIIKELIKFINDKVEQGSVNAEQFVKYKSWIAWFEKQGEHANFRNKIQIGDKVTRNEDGVLVNLSQLNRVAKPTDKVEPKFKVGDFIADYYCRGRVVELTDDSYLLDTGQGIPFSCEHNAHLWTIQDAKAGDVLSDGKNIILFRNIGNGEWNDVVDYYCGCVKSRGNDVFDMQEDDQYWCCIKECILLPATKEQHDLLFAKMKEAGYEWDAEKKELRKIEQKPVPKFKVGDVVRSSNGASLLIVGITDYCYNCVTCATNDEYSFGFDIQDEFELVEQKPWSEEGEKVKVLVIKEE